MSKTDGSPPTASLPLAEQRSLVLAAGGLLVVVVVATILALGAKLDRSQPEFGFAIPLGDEGTYVPFAGADDPAQLPQVPDGRSWLVVNGTWGTLARAAYVAEPVVGEGTTVAALSAPADASSLVRLSVVADDAGLAFRLVDGQNYLAALVRTREGAVELVQVRDGATTVLARSSTGLTLPDGCTLRVVHEGTTARVTVDGVQVLEAAIPAADGPTSVGMVAGGPQATVARFDDLTILPVQFVR